MKIKDVEALYNADKNQYLLTNRPGFVLWYNQNYGDSHWLDLDELQELVDKIVAWYVFRYPNRLLNNSSLDYRFNNTKDLSSEMDIKQLFYRLSPNEFSLFECKYRSNCGYSQGAHNYCGIQISKLNATPNEILTMNNTRKKISGLNFGKNKNTLDDFTITENGNLSCLTQTLYDLPFLSIEEFYELYKEEFDMTKVLECINIHNNDLILRNHIVDAIRQGLLYYAHTTPEYGKYRMDKFTSDITTYYEDIDLENKKYVAEDAKTTKPKGLIKRLRGDKK